MEERRMRTEAVVCAILTVLFATAESQSVQCFTQLDCLGTGSTATNFTTCCLGPCLSYNTGGPCQTCIVIGWSDALNSSDNTINTSPVCTELERAESYKTQVGFLKGSGATIQATVETIPGTAGIRDYLVSSTDVRISAIRMPNIYVILKVDLLAMEPLENFTLRLKPDDIDYSKEIVINDLIIQIIDNDNVSIRFTALDYRQLENIATGLIPVVVEQRAVNGALSGLANPIVIKVVPVNFTDSGAGLLPGITSEFSTTVPNEVQLAKSNIDFNTSIIYGEFKAGDTPRDLDTPVQIFNDNIDEVTEFFGVKLELVSAVNEDHVFLDERNESFCRIVDDDDISLSFERSSYTVNETDHSLWITVVKEPRGIAETEITYTFSIQVITSPTAGKAKKFVDFVLPSRFNNDIKPSQQSFILQIIILDDTVPEEAETFQVLLSNVPNELQFKLGTYSSATITIIDYDTILVGFVENMTVVSESVGSFIETVRVFLPEPYETLPVRFFLELQTQDGSAVSPDDYVSIKGRSNPLISTPPFGQNVRERNVTVTIEDDNRFEYDEVFSLTLASQNGTQDVSPSVFMITIVDDDILVLGFQPVNYTGSEGGVQVELLVVVLNGTIGSDITLSVNTSDGSADAGSDYIALSDFQFTMTRDQTTATIPVRVLRDALNESEEQFTATLNLVSPSSPRLFVSQNTTNVLIQNTQDYNFTCLELTEPIYGQVAESGFTPGHNATYTCNSGYRLVGDSPRTCQENEQWSGTAPTCEPITCPNLPGPANGQIAESGSTPPFTAKYTCNTGYRLVGDSPRTCQDNGQWSGTTPTCEPNCRDLTGPTNGQLVESGFTPAATATYTCNSGYQMVGNSARTCQNNGQWSGTAPTCELIHVGFVGNNIAVKEGEVQKVCVASFRPLFNDSILVVEVWNSTASDSDFSLTSTGLKITPTNQEDCLVVIALDDDVALEGEETVILTLTGPNSVTITNSVLEVTIIDTDAAVPEEKNSNLVLFIVLATIAIVLLLVVIVIVIVAVLIHKKRQQQQSEAVTMAQVATPLNTIETLKEEGIYEKIDDCSEDEKDTSLQETTNDKTQEPTNERKSLSPVVMKQNMVYGDAAADGYGGGIAPVVMMENVSYSIVGAGYVGADREYVGPQAPIYTTVS